jgi:hypothetical protein
LESKAMMLPWRTDSCVLATARGIVGDMMRPDDAAFVVALRNSAPALLDAAAMLERVKPLLEQLGNAMTGAGCCCDDVDEAVRDVEAALARLRG